MKPLYHCSGTIHSLLVMVKSEWSFAGLVGTERAEPKVSGIKCSVTFRAPARFVFLRDIILQARPFKYTAVYPSKTKPTHSFS